MHRDLLSRISALEDAMADRLYLPKQNLASLLRAARGRLPRPVLRQARELVDVRARLENPATAKALNLQRANATCDLLERALAEVPEGKYRRRFWSARVGSAAMNVLLVLLLFGAFLWWRQGS